jgi:hypothetical protein
MMAAGLHRSFAIGVAMLLQRDRAQAPVCSASPRQPATRARRRNQLCVSRSRGITCSTTACEYRLQACPSPSRARLDFLARQERRARAHPAEPRWRTARGN